MTKTDVENIYQKRKGDNKMNELHNFNNGEMDDMKVLFVQINNMENTLAKVLEMLEQQNETLEKQETALGEQFDMIVECNDNLIEQNDRLETFFDEISDPLTNRQEQENEKKNGLLSMFAQMFTRKVQSSVS